MSNHETHCGACSGTEILTPQAPDNTAGLPWVGYRAGEYRDFYLSMSARLSSAEYGALGVLTTRDSKDFTLALIDAWSASCDVLTFYNEMWINEAYVRTAQETASLHMLAALIDYAPHPGAAASADLAFTVAAGEGIPEVVTIPAGTKVQSTPGQDEDPVLFETLDDLTARAAWNAIRPKLTAPHPLTAETTLLPLPGTNLNLKPGDAVYFVADDDTPVFATINEVTPVLADIAKDPDSKDLTWLSISPLTTEPLSSSPAAGGGTMVMAMSGGSGVYLDSILAEDDLKAVLIKDAIAEKAFFSPFIEIASPERQVQVFRTSAGIFGNAAPPLASLHHSLTGNVPVYTKNGDDVVVSDLEPGPYAGATESTWADEGTLTLMSAGVNHVYLERAVSSIGKESVVVLRDGDSWFRYQVVDTNETSASFFAVTGKSTQLTLNTENHFGDFSIRGTTAYGASEWITLAEPPITEPLHAESISLMLNGWFPGLEADRNVILSGLVEGLGEEPVIVKRTLQSVSHALQTNGGTTVTFTESIGSRYLPQTLTIAANVAEATQGETVAEVLGDGSATPHLSFITKQAPQTFVPAETESGVKPTLEVRENNILWQQVPNFLEASPTDRVYTLKMDEAGFSKVTFGDGVLGAMPGKGQQNIRASYRKTLGLMGRVKAGQLNLLMSQPLGLQGVRNPMAAEGGADPESRDAIRQSAPLSCRTLGRVVSLTDYADFARAYGGIAKASSQWLHLAGGPQVVLTVAAEEGAQVPEGSKLYDALSDALVLAGDPFARFMLRSFRQTYFRLGVKLQVNSLYLEDEVLAQAETVLRDALSFEARDFGQPVFASEIIALLHTVGGVDAVIVERLYTGATPTRHDGIAAPMAEVVDGDALGASILSLHPGALDFLEASL